VEVIMEISDILREQDIILGMQSKGKRSALARTAALLAKRVGENEHEILAALLHRERLGSSGIGGGVAVPHALLHDVQAPVSTLATLREPIWFDSPDDVPVDLLLGLLWPKSDAVGLMQGLALVCRLLRQTDLRSRLRASETAAEAHAWIEHFDVAVKRHPKPPLPPVRSDKFASSQGRNAWLGRTCLARGQTGVGRTATSMR
jgi:PTS system nitrogen regulatory IIA component